MNLLMEGLGLPSSREHNSTVRYLDVSDGLLQVRDDASGSSDDQNRRAGGAEEVQHVHEET